jgi:hypothetical protein
MVPLRENQDIIRGLTHLSSVIREKKMKLYSGSQICRSLRRIQHEAAQLSLDSCLFRFQPPGPARARPISMWSIDRLRSDLLIWSIKFRLNDLIDWHTRHMSGIWHGQQGTWLVRSKPIKFFQGIVRAREYDIDDHMPGIFWNVMGIYHVYVYTFWIVKWWVYTRNITQLFHVYTTCI